MLGVTLASVRAHKGRYAASAVAVMIAVAFIVTTMTLAATVERSITDSLGMQYRGTDVVLEGEFAPTDVELVRGTPGVAAAAAGGSMFVTTTAPGSGAGWATAEALPAAGPLRWQTLTEGRYPESPGEVLAGSTSGFVPGTAITLSAAHGEGTRAVWTVVGIVDLRGSPQAMNGAALYASESDLAALGVPVTSIHVAGADADALKAHFAAAFPEATVASGTEAASAAAQQYLGTSGLLRNVLLGFAAIAVVVAGLVIANTFAVIVAARTRELALLRAVGATSHQVRRSVRAEAAIIGVAASVAGIALGAGLAFALRALGGAIDLPIPIHSVAVPWTGVAAALFVGIAVSLAAAHAPAQAATRVSPLAALRPLEAVPDAVGVTRMRMGAGALLAAVGTGLLVYGAASESVMLGCLGGLASFLAVVVLAPRIIPGAVASAGAVLARVSGPVGDLAARNAGRNPRRTTATALALLIGVTLTATFVTGAGLSKVAAAASVDEEFPVDVAVTLADGGVEGDVATVALDIEKQIAAVPGVDAAARALKQTVLSGDSTVTAFAVTPEFGSVVRGNTALPNPGELVLPASSADLVDGDTLTTSGGTPLRPVLGGGKQIALISMESVDDSPPTWITVAVRLSEGLDGNQLRETQQHIAAIVDELAPGADIVGTASERAVTDTIIDTMLMIVAGLLSIAVVIALIGVGNTMALAVLERRRESALLRVAGLHRQSLRTLLVWEAMLVAGCAATLGVGLGLVFGIAGTASVFGSDKVALSAIPAAQLAVIVCLALGAAVLATLVPARRAMRAAPVEALGG